MAFTFREPGLLISSVAHVAVLTAGLVAFTSVQPFPDADEGIPVEMITENMFSEITRGETDASEAVENPQPRADRVEEIAQLRPTGEATLDSPTPPTRPQEIAEADEPDVAPEPPPPPPPPPPPSPPPPEPSPPAPPPPPPAPTPPEPPPEPEPAPAPEPAPEPEPEPEPQPEPVTQEPTPLPPARAARAQAQREAQARVQAERQQAERQEAERRQQEAQRREAQQREQAQAQAQARTQAPAEAERPPAARRDSEVAERFNPDGIAALLRSTEAPASRGATGQEINRTASLGTATGTAARLNPSQRDALIGVIQAQLRRCWEAPIAAQSLPNPPVASLRIALNADGSLAGTPQVMNDAGDGLFRAVADSASRATRRCAPLRIPAEFAPYYEDWKSIVVNFDPRDA